MTTISEELRSFALENFLFGQDGDSLSDDVSFLGSGIIDSTGILELIGFVERTYGFRLEDEDIVPDNLDSIGKLTRFVERKLQQLACETVGAHTDSGLGA